MQPISYLGYVYLYDNVFQKMIAVPAIKQYDSSVWIADATHENVQWVRLPATGSDAHTFTQVTVL